LIRLSGDAGHGEASPLKKRCDRFRTLDHGSTFLDSI
jgi:hypothetical protein